MSKALRSLKISPPGKLPRRTVRKAVASVHVFPSDSGGSWQVKEIGPVGTHKRFASRLQAVKFAKAIASKKHSGVVLHQRHARLQVGKQDDDAVYKLVFD